jgi:hypothetical protein
MVLKYKPKKRGLQVESNVYAGEDGEEAYGDKSRNVDGQEDYERNSYRR